ncbi:MAG: alpha/beta fold hydrolase [bacterium]|nr:alpha/beta fold hydrolase [bacterium]
MPKVNSQSVDIAYEVLNPGGDAIPVFFITGLPGVRAAWFKQTGAFTKRGPVVLHDHRGTGESAKPLGVYSIEAMAEDVIAIMDAEGIEKGHMVGSSTGGAIIQALCVDHPGRVQSAVMVGTWAKSDEFFLRQYGMRKRVLLEMGVEAYTQFAAYTVYPPRFVAENDEMLKDWVKLGVEPSPPVEVVAERIDAILAHDQLGRIGQIKAPTLILGARDDFITPPYYAEQLKAGIPGAELDIFEEGGHLLFQPYAEKFNEKVPAFIARNEP